MNEQLPLLIELQKADSEIAALRKIIDGLPARLSSSEAPFKEAESLLLAAQQNHAALEKKKRAKEQAIEDLQEKIRKIRQRSTEIKTNKEYQAHLKEIETMERDISSTEDDLLVLMEELDESLKVVSGAKARVAAETRTRDLLRAELEKEIVLRQESLKGLVEVRDSLAAKLDPRAYALYRMILKSGRGLAVAEAVNEVCRGCNIHIPPQLFVELRSSDELIQCPQCRRILFYVRTEKDGHHGKSPLTPPLPEDEDDE